jgi:ribosome-binding ATPase YchF (GTP1/OBG family)
VVADLGRLTVRIAIAAARAVGKARIEGKDYVMRDGDVVEFRFSPT